MTIQDFTATRAIRTALFVRIAVPDYAVIRVSDSIYPDTIGGETYLPLGRLLTVSDSVSQLRTAPGELTVTLSGIPTGSIAEFVDQAVRGSEIQVWRRLYNAQSGVTLGSALGRFQGLVNAISVTDDQDARSQSGTTTILVTATSWMELYANKISGRRTNPTDQRAIAPTDASMDRVLRLKNANINWGAP